jgi:UDP-glucose 4-epimerase
VSLLELVERLIELAGKGSFVLRPFPEDRKRIDIGDFFADTTRIRKTLGWEPRVSLRSGLEQTLAYYERHKAEYL